MNTRIHIAAPLIALSLAAASVAFAQQGDKLGKAEFPNSCSPAVQEKLLRGGAMLHSFYYSAAQKAFEEVAAEALGEYEASQQREPNRYRGLYGAGQAAAQSGNRDKARHYFSKLIELAGSGDLRPEMERVRRYLASN